MAAPATTDAFLDLVRRSGMIDPAQLDAFRDRVAGEGAPDKAYRLARRMVKDGLLTNFQAEQLLKGKYKGFSLGNYRVLERVGRGGMGSVFLAEHKTMRHRAAVKVLPPEQAEHAPVVERFYREARSSSALCHPNIVRAYDVGCENGIHYLVMEYVEGVDLQVLVGKVGALTTARAAHYIGQAAMGLQYAHEAAGLVHRDIKPGNLLVDRTGTIKILDMGLARLTQTGFFDEDLDSITRKHNDKSILGTADYIAPEQALNSQAADTRADIYSLGATFYFLLAGRAPFESGSVTQKLLWHQVKEPMAVSAFRDDVPADVAALISRMMAKDPARRPQTPGEVALALAPYLALPSPVPTEQELPQLSPAAQGPASGSANLLGPLAGPQSGSFALSPSAALSGRMLRSPTPTAEAEPAPAAIPLAIPVAAPVATLVPETPEKRRWAPWAIAAGVLVAVAGGALVLVLGS